MVDLKTLSCIFFDFDGVILDSNEIKDIGFATLFKKYPKNIVDQLVTYNQNFGGISRFIKIRYFYETLLGESVSEETVQAKASEFSKIMLDTLQNPDLIFQDTLSFIKKIHKQIPLHIISGTEEMELKQICKSLELDRYFISIHGSPVKKEIHINNLLEKHHYPPHKTLMIGDSKVEFESARKNNCLFMGCRNDDLTSLGEAYIPDFSNIQFHLKG